MGSESRNTKPELLKKARTHRNKAIRFVSQERGDVPPITWYAAYRGKYGWSACRGNGEWMDEPSDEAVQWAIEEGADEVELVDLSELPEEVAL